MNKRAVPRSHCPINFALEIFGDRWTLLVLRDIVIKGRQRYSELLAAEEGIATNILSDRLKRLELRGLVDKRPDDGDRRQFVYVPTERAIGLIPMLLELIVWGARNDPRTDAPSAFVRRYERDRDALVAELTREARSRLATFAARGDQHE